MVGEPVPRVRDLIREICGAHDVKIMRGHVSKDHVQLLVSIAPQETISRLLQWLKGKTVHKVDDGKPAHKKHYGYNTCGCGGIFADHGNVTDEMIAEHIAHQNDDRDDDFKVDGGVRRHLEGRLAAGIIMPALAGIRTHSTLPQKPSPFYPGCVGLYRLMARRRRSSMPESTV